MYLLKKYYIYVICVVFLLISSSQVSADCLAWNFTGHCILFDDVPIDEQIEDAVEYVSRCGVNGEGTLYVRNKTRTTKYFKINGLIDGSYDTEIAPGKEVKGTFCNRDMVGVEIYSSTDCGRTYLGQSKTVRAYTKEAIDLTSNGFKFHVHDVLDPIQRISGLALTLVAESYGIDPEVLAALGVREADIINACRKGNPACVYKIYNYLPQELKLKVKQDNCLRNAYVEGKKNAISEPTQQDNGRQPQEADARHRQQRAPPRQDNGRQPQEAQPRLYYAVALAWGGGVWQMSARATRQEASEEALNRCNQRFFGGCSLSTSSLDSSNFGCIGLVRTMDGSNELYSAIGNSNAAAQNRAMESCRNTGRPCALEKSACNNRKK